MMHDEERKMSLTRIFARALSGFGMHPAALAQRQMLDAIDRGDETLAGKLLEKYPDAPQWYARSKGMHRMLSLFEITLDESEFGIAAAMVKACPRVLTLDYSKGETSVGRTLLMQLCIGIKSSGAPDFLIGAGIDVKKSDDDGNTALHFAAGSESPGVLVSLLDAGANVDAVNKEGHTPLMLATRGHTPLMIEPLLQHQANIGLCDANGLNATMHAIRHQNIEAATALLQLGGVITDLQDPALATLENVAAHEAQWDFLKLVGSQRDKERRRTETLAKQAMKELCETSIPGAITVRRPLVLKK